MDYQRRADVCAVWLLSLLLFTSLQLSYRGIADVDPYYHIRMGELYRQELPLRQFAWMTHGLYAERYSDKDFGYHVLLSLIPSRLDHLEVTGPKLFTAGLSATVTALVYLLLGTCGWPARFWTLFFVAASPLFIFRLQLIRPHVLSIVFFLAGMLALKNKRIWWLFVINLLYTTCYSLPFILTATTFIMASYSRLMGVWFLRPFLTCVCANLAGLLLNPYFPDNLCILWYQGYHVLKNAFTPAAVPVACELEGMSTRLLLASFPFLVVVFPLMSLCGSHKLFQRDPFRVLIRIMNLLLFFATLWSHRFCEYWVPIAIVDGYSAFMRVVQRTVHIKTSLRYLVATAAFLALVGLSAFTCRQALLTLRVHVLPVPLLALRYLQTHCVGSTIFHLGWSDWALLFGLNPNNQYICGLDPAFLYNYDRAKWDAWEAIGTGRDMDYPLTIKEMFGCTTILVQKHYGWFWTYAARDPRIEVRYRDNVAMVCRIRREEFGYATDWEASRVSERKMVPSATSYIERLSARQFLHLRPSRVPAVGDQWRYLRTVVNASVGRKATVRFGNDGEAVVYLRGQRIIEDRTHGLPTPDECQTQVELAPGENEFIVETTACSMGFFLSVKNE